MKEAWINNKNNKQKFWNRKLRPWKEIKKLKHSIKWNSPHPGIILMEEQILVRCNLICRLLKNPFVFLRLSLMASILRKSKFLRMMIPIKLFKNLEMISILAKMQDKDFWNKSKSKYKWTMMTNDYFSVKFCLKEIIKF